MIGSIGIYSDNTFKGLSKQSPITEMYRFFLLFFFFRHNQIDKMTLSIIDYGFCYEFHLGKLM